MRRGRTDPALPDVRLGSEADVRVSSPLPVLTNRNLASLALSTSRDLPHIAAGYVHPQGAWRRIGTFCDEHHSASLYRALAS
jgi:hypothetical protein